MKMTPEKREAMYREQAETMWEKMRKETPSETLSWNELSPEVQKKFINRLKQLVMQNIKGELK